MRTFIITGNNRLVQLPTAHKMVQPVQMSRKEFGRRKHSGVPVCPHGLSAYFSPRGTRERGVISITIYLPNREDIPYVHGSTELCLKVY